MGILAIIDKAVNADLVIGMTKACGAANYLFWLEQLQPTICETDSNRNNGPNGFQSLDIHNVHFSYPMRPSAQILRGVRLKVITIF